MADYNAILKRAISALPEPTGEARRAVYEKARTALIAQLKSFDPPLTASEITQQRLQLEDAIRRVESEAAKGILAQSLNRLPPSGASLSPSAAGQAPVAAPTAAGQPAPVSARTPGAPPPAAEQTAPAPVRPAPPQPAEAAPRADRPPRATLTAPRPQTFDRGGSRPPRAKTEAGEAAEPTSGQAAPIPPHPPAGNEPRKSPLPERHPEPADAPKPTLAEADMLGGASAESTPQGKTAPAAVRPAPAPADEAAPSDGKPPKLAKREKSKKPRRDGPPDAAVLVQPPTRRLPLLIGVSVAGLVVAMGVTVLWTKRDEVTAYFGTERTATAPARGSNDKPLPQKITDRILTDDGQQARAPAAAPGGVKVVTTQPITATPGVQPEAPASAKPQAAAVANDAPTAATPALPPVATAPSAAPVALPTQPVPLVVQKASLLEEGPTGSGQNTTTAGKVVWQTVRESPQQGKPPVTFIRARVEVPDRGIVLNLAIQPNSDSAFPASHLIELRFEVPPDFDNKGVSNVPGVIMKATEQARGDALVGASARISNGFFWIALSSMESDRQRNLGILKDRGWIDIPILYDNGRRAILTLEKAGAGDRVVADAMGAWDQGG